jgi:hypothetical protein
VELLAASAGKATLEPMLWNVPLLLVLHKILDDKTTHSPTSPHHNLARFAKYDHFPLPLPPYTCQPLLPLSRLSSPSSDPPVPPPVRV